MKGCCERHTFQAVISSNFYLLGNKKRIDYILSVGEAYRLTDVLRAPLASQDSGQGSDVQPAANVSATWKRTEDRECKKI